jgi:hypothetical protein
MSDRRSHRRTGHLALDPVARSSVRAPLSGRLSARGLPAVGWLYDIVGTAAVHGHASFIEYSAGGAMTRAERTRRWCLDNADVLQQALIRQAEAQVTALRRSVCHALQVSRSQPP